MRSPNDSRGPVTDRRQRLQIGGGALAVAVIWVLALWPSGDDRMEQQSGPLPVTSPGPWTTGPFSGTVLPRTSAARSTPATSTSDPVATTRSAAPGGDPAPGTDPAAPPTSGWDDPAPPPQDQPPQTTTKESKPKGKPTDPGKPG